MGGCGRGTRGDQRVSLPRFGNQSPRREQRRGFLQRPGSRRGAGDARVGRRGNSRFLLPVSGERSGLELLDQRLPPKLTGQPRARDSRRRARGGLDRFALPGPEDVGWRGATPRALGLVYQPPRTPALSRRVRVLGVGDHAYAGGRTQPAIVALDSRSVVTLQEKRDGNWSIWMRVLQNGVIPLTGSVRVDEDQGLADQLDPAVGMGAAGHALFVWADSRSPSSG